MVKLTFQLIDNWAPYNQTMMGGIGVVRTRLVEIVLTPDQAKILKPQKIGSDGMTPIFEDIKFIQMDSNES